MLQYAGQEITEQTYLDELKKRINLDKQTRLVFDLIFDSTLDPVLKVGMLGNFDSTCRGFYDVVQDNSVVCYMDSCFEFLENNGFSDSEAPEAEVFLKEHFVNNLVNFPYHIRTEDYCFII